MVKSSDRLLKTLHTETPSYSPFSATLGLTSSRFTVFILPLMVEGLDSCPVRVVAIEE